MLRIFAFVLLALNVGYFAWSTELVRGFGPTPQSEIQRLKQQIRPQDVRVLGHVKGWAFSVLYSMGVQLNAVGIDNAPQGRSFGGGSGSYAQIVKVPFSLLFRSQ